MVATADVIGSKITSLSLGFDFHFLPGFSTPCGRHMAGAAAPWRRRHLGNPATLTVCGNFLRA